METLYIQIELLSETTFGRGDGVAGLVDTEVEHDTATGLPYLKGRTLKGLLVEACADILYALDNNRAKPDLINAGKRLFGQGGSSVDDDAQMRIGDAHLPDELRAATAYSVHENSVYPSEVLESLTTIRRQTAVDTLTGMPDTNSLRSERVVLRHTTLIAPLDFVGSIGDVDKALLSAVLLGVRHGGINRNRGRGRLKLSLLDTDQHDITDRNLNVFSSLVGGK